MADKKAEVTPKGINTPQEGKVPANVLMRDFLVKNNLKLVQDPIVQGIKQVNDGSIIMTLPAITAQYNE